MPMWRKVTIAICSLVIIVCLILLGNIDNIICYDYYYVDTWDYHNKSHIGNISQHDSRGYNLDDNWVNIGNHYWYSNDIEDVNSDKDLGDLIRLYSYSINKSSDPHYGETASLWIYDITQKCLQLGMSRDAFYQKICNEYTRDSKSFWEEDDSFLPFLALSIRPFTGISRDNDSVEHIGHFIIFANDRVYSFNFRNDKWKKIGPEYDELFHKRCLSIIKDIDFLSYNQWEKDYNRYKDLSAKEKDQRELWGIILYVILLVSGLCIFYLISKDLGRKNSHARNLAIYTIICMALSFLIYGAMAIDNPNLSGTLAFVLFNFLPSILVDNILTVLLQVSFLQVSYL